MVKKIILAFFAAVFIILISACGKETKDVDYLFQITAFKTGNSDCLLLESQNKKILIDTSNRDNGRKIARFLKEKDIKKIDLLIISNFNSNNIGGFEILSDKLEISNIIEPNYKENTDVYNKYIEKLGEKNINIITAQKNLKFSLDDLDFGIYISKNDYENKNNNSLITAITHGENSFLFLGDIENERCSEIIGNDIKNYNFVKVPHHGIYFERAEELFEKIMPQISLITCDNTGDAEKINIILHNLNSKQYFTKDGEVTITSDGKTLKVIQE